MGMYKEYIEEFDYLDLMAWDEDHEYEDEDEDESEEGEE
jgi:hypothetical protein